MSELQAEQPIDEPNDTMEEKLLISEIKIIDLKKELMTSYGLIRVIDNLIDHLCEVPHEVVVLVELLRAQLSDTIDKEIFNIKEMDISEYV